MHIGKIHGKNLFEFVESQEAKVTSKIHCYRWTYRSKRFLTHTMDDVCIWFVLRPIGLVVVNAQYNIDQVSKYFHKKIHTHVLEKQIKCTMRTENEFQHRTDPPMKTTSNITRFHGNRYIHCGHFSFVRLNFNGMKIQRFLSLFLSHSDSFYNSVTFRAYIRGRGRCDSGLCQLFVARSHCASNRLDSCNVTNLWLPIFVV